MTSSPKDLVPLFEAFVKDRAAAHAAGWLYDVAGLTAVLVPHARRERVHAGDGQAEALVPALRSASV